MFKSPNLHPVDSLHPNQALEDHPVSDSDESSPSVKILSSRKNKVIYHFGYVCFFLLKLIINLISIPLFFDIFF